MNCLPKSSCIGRTTTLVLKKQGYALGDVMEGCLSCRSGALVDPERHSYCWFCGARLKGLTVEMVGGSEPLYVDQVGQNACINLELRLTNQGVVDLSLEELHCRLT